MTKKRWAIAAGAAVIILCICVYFNREALALKGFDLFLADSLEKKLENTYKPVDRNVPVPVPVSSEEKEKPFSVLLLGVDQRGNEIGRSDSIIYTVVRPADGRLLMVSIPRDFYVELVGRDKQDKINHAFAYGGAGMTMDTVEKLLGAPVHYYTSINFQGFRDAIDAIGGIALPITEDIINNEPGHEYFFIKGGQDYYNGVDALNFVRYREDAGGDVSRTERHGQFLNALMDKATSLKQWSKIPDLIEIMGNNFSMDMRPEQLIDLAQSMLQAKQRIVYSHTLKGKGGRLVSGGAWYYFADEEDLAQTSLMIESWLDADTPVNQLIVPDSYNQGKVDESDKLLSSAERTE